MAIHEYKGGEAGEKKGQIRIFLPNYPNAQNMAVMKCLWGLWGSWGLGSGHTQGVRWGQVEPNLPELGHGCSTGAFWCRFQKDYWKRYCECVTPDFEDIPFIVGNEKPCVVERKNVFCCEDFTSNKICFTAHTAAWMTVPLSIRKGEGG